jgi:hypothetical protein
VNKLVATHVKPSTLKLQYDNAALRCNYTDTSLPAKAARRATATALKRWREGLEVDGHALIRAVWWSIRVIPALTLESAISGLDYLPLDFDSLSAEIYE